MERALRRGNAFDTHVEAVELVADLAAELRALTSRHHTAEREFLAASVAVWREIDRLAAQPGGYSGLDASTELRRRERAAWEAFRAVLDQAKDPDRG
jgi:hypothetical protein